MHIAYFSRIFLNNIFIRKVLEHASYLKTKELFHLTDAILKSNTVFEYPLKLNKTKQHVIQFFQSGGIYVYIDMKPLMHIILIDQFVMLPFLRTISSNFITVKHIFYF